jgi:hypothetical protein
MVHVRDDRDVPKVHDVDAFRFFWGGSWLRAPLQLFPEKGEGLARKGFSFKAERADGVEFLSFGPLRLISLLLTGRELGHGEGYATSSERFDPAVLCL